jgi:hypothetical protein
MNRLTIASTATSIEQEAVRRGGSRRLQRPGFAWFDLSEVGEFCTRLGDYPLDPVSPPSLAGGHWEDGEAAHLVETHLSLRFSPHDHTGRIRADVDLAGPLSGRAS